MSAMGDLDITLHLGEAIHCECNDPLCRAEAKVMAYHRSVIIALTSTDDVEVSVLLTPRTAAALAILLDEASRDASANSV